MWFREGKGAALDLPVSLCLYFVFGLAPTDPWQTPEKPFTVQAIRIGERRANFMGTGSEIGSTLQKKSRGGCLSVLKRLGVSQWLANNGMHTHIDHALQSTHKLAQTPPCTDAPIQMCTSGQAVNSRHADSFCIWLWVSGMAVYDLGLWQRSWAL